MKKIIRIILLTFLSFFNFSCHKESMEPFLLEGNLNNTSLTFLSSSELKNKIMNQDDFVLMITLSTCSTCERFVQEVLNVYISQTHAIIYGIDLLTLNASDDYENKPYCQQAPQMMIYRNGQIMNQLKYEYGKEEYSSVDGFKKYMEKYVIEPKILSISEELLDQKISTQESFLLYIGWNKCGDCHLLESRILNSYLKDSSINGKIYYLESDPYRRLLPKTKPIYHEDYTAEEKIQYEEDLKNYNNWISFSTKYQFNFYRNGKVPVLQYYEKGTTTPEKMIVYHNDVLKDEIVIESYFKELINQHMSEEDLLDYHDKQAINFLNKYFK